MSHLNDDSHVTNHSQFLGIHLADWLTFSVTFAGGLVLGGAAGRWLARSFNFPSTVATGWADGTFIGALIGATVAIAVCVADVAIRRRHKQ